MPPVSEAQRRLMHGAANTKGGMGGVPQSVGQDFANADTPGKLPEKVGKKPSNADRLYRKKAVKRG